MTMVWELSQAYREQYVVEIDYLRVGDTEARKRRVYSQANSVYVVRAIDEGDVSFLGRVARGGPRSAADS